MVKGLQGFELVAMWFIASVLQVENNDFGDLWTNNLSQILSVLFLLAIPSGSLQSAQSQEGLTLTYQT